MGGGWCRPPTGGEAATVLAAVKVRCSPASPCSLGCAWLRVAARFPSPPLRAVAVGAPGRDERAGSPVEPESRVWLAAAAALSRSGLRVTAPIGVQLRVDPLQRRGWRSRACWYRAWRGGGGGGAAPARGGPRGGDAAG